ncbi:MAG TPA: hypothetical protein VNL71_12530 [Chloroflexota bacterium]|nr:hypothetical protein [Chloroflexota bacterium]
MAIASIERAPTGTVVLDIGEDVGALIVHADPRLRGREIEVSPKGNAARRTHTEVLERRVGGRPLFAAVFPTLAAGQYSIWRDVMTDEEVTIVGAAVVELDWRHISDPSDFRLSRPERGTLSPALPPERARARLPARYGQGRAANPAPMASASMHYSEDGQVAWDAMWTEFCDLALAGGPRHRDTLLEPAAAEEALAAPEEYARVVAEIERGLRLVTGLPTTRDDSPGWVGLRCEGEEMARWLLSAIAVENVSIRRQGPVLFLPAAPSFRLDKEIKNVVTVVAKTHHYWLEHREE